MRTSATALRLMRDLPPLRVEPSASLSVASVLELVRELFGFPDLRDNARLQVAREHIAETLLVRLALFRGESRGASRSCTKALRKRPAWISRPTRKAYAKGKPTMPTTVDAESLDRLAEKYAALPVRDLSAWERKQAITRQHLQLFFEQLGLLSEASR